MSDFFRQTIPTTRSDIGIVYRDSDEEFFVNVRDIKEDEVNDYVNKCKKQGFDISYNSEEEIFSGSNAEGYEIILHSYGNNRAEIYIKAPVQLQK